ncbi:tRNA methyltransferase 10 homolog A [Eumeta japonica]|uniref:tRNA (guanine(9)-N(1))-methyltransferase n=1 Tax=Eumeta variegata TaxID=151549 RepID=A0A4C1TBR5_EUMVA|nr:tRNA methyltransferase 10 homolog A [Eumeta japonica]
MDPICTLPVKEIKIPTEWGFIAGKLWGNDQQRPILALHAWQDNAGTWDTLIPLLSKEHSYLAIDFPGHGQSSWFPPGMHYSCWNWLRTVTIVKDHFKWDKVSLLGHSMGGTVCTKYAGLHPEFVDMSIVFENLILEDVYVSTENRMKFYLQNVRKQLLKMNSMQKHYDKEAPSYLYEEAVQMYHLKTNRSVSLESAPYLIKRGTKASHNDPNKICFSIDLRVKNISIVTPNDISSVTYIKNIKCPFLFIKGTDSKYGLKELNIYVEKLLPKINDNFGFFDSNGSSLCMLCSKLLPNSSMAPAKLRRHLETVHPESKDKNKEFFVCKKEQLLESQKNMMIVTQTINEKTTEAYLVSYRIAQAGEAHTNADNLIKPCVLDITKCMLDEKSAKHLSTVPLSNDTVSREFVSDNDSEMFQDDVFEELVQYVTSIRASLEKYFPEEQNTKMKHYSWIHNPFAPNLQKPKNIPVPIKIVMVDNMSSIELKNTVITFPKYTLFDVKFDPGLKDESGEELPRPFTKNQMRKWLKKVKWENRKHEKRAKEKARAKEKRIQARAANIDLGPSRKSLKKMSGERRKLNIGIIIDLSFDHLMIEKCRFKVIKQILRCYSMNRRSATPLDFYITNFSEQSKLDISRHNGYEHWDVHFKEKSYIDIFPKEKLFYLTSESDNVVEKFEEDTYYIIGGLVDHNEHKGLCYNIAVEHGIRHGQLPLQKYVNMKTRKVLTIDHVFEIVLRICEGMSWPDTLMKVLPIRKGAQVCSSEDNSLINSDHSDIELGENS